MITYKLHDNELIIEDDSTGKELWHGKPYGCSVVKIAPLQDSDGCIVLLDLYEFTDSDFHYLGNLILIGSDGKVKWNAELLGSHDAHVDFNYVNNELTSYMLTGFYVHIDPRTGKILSKIFTR